MQRDEIIEMAKQAGGKGLHLCTDKAETTIAMRLDFEQLEAFSNLVADKTRKELREEIIYTWVPPHFVDLAVKEEREACAKVCETRLGPTATDFYGNVYAQAIRARGEA